MGVTASDPRGVTGTGVTPKDAREAENSWASWGWLMPGIWLLFLAFPVVSLVTDPDIGPVGTTLGVLGVLAFVAIYLAGFNMLMGGFLCRYRFPGWRHVCVAGMWVCVALVSLVLGGMAVNLAPYVLAFYAFTLPFRQALAYGLGSMAAVAVIFLLTGEDGVWFLVLVMAGVLAVCLVMSFLINSDERAQDVKRNLAVVSERERVARDVHDGLGHTLTVVALKAELAERVMDTDPTRAKAELADLHRLTREALEQVRATVSGLRETDLPNQVAALTMTLEGAGLEVDVVGDPAAVDPELQPAISQVLREAGTNVLRHADAGRCSIEFLARSVTMTDDGVGVGEAPAGHGRRGMAERLAAVGADLRVAQRREGGTEVLVTW